MRLKLDSIDDNDVRNKPYVFHCFNSMKEISKSMYLVKTIKDDDDVDGNIVQIYERNYIITMVSTLCKEGCLISGMMSGEVAKSLCIEGCSISETYAEIKKKINTAYESTPKYVYPDFLIHENHNSQDINTSKQHFIVEAKTSPIQRKELFYLDFLKLNYYIEYLHYENAGYLIVNNKEADIQNYLDSYMEDVGFKCKDIFHKMFFFIQEEIDSAPQLYRLVNSQNK